VLVLYEPGRAGDAAVALAQELAERDHATVTVLGVVPKAPSGARCGNSALEYNEMVREAVVRDLERARTQLAELGGRAEFELLAEGSDPSLGEWVTRAGVDVVLLPSRRRLSRSAKHPAAAALRRATGAEIQIVDARATR
jgi:nucleotide-binding universal stress UspA family protein